MDPRTSKVPQFNAYEEVIFCRSTNSNSKRIDVDGASLSLGPRSSTVNRPFSGFEASIPLPLLRIVCKEINNISTMKFATAALLIAPVAAFNMDMTFSLGKKKAKKAAPKKVRDACVRE